MSISVLFTPTGASRNQYDESIRRQETQYVPVLDCLQRTEVFDIGELHCVDGAILVLGEDQDVDHADEAAFDEIGHMETPSVDERRERDRRIGVVGRHHQDVGARVDLANGGDRLRAEVLGVRARVPDPADARDPGHRPQQVGEEGTDPDVLARGGSDSLRVMVSGETTAAAQQTANSRLASNTDTSVAFSSPAEAISVLARAERDYRLAMMYLAGQVAPEPKGTSVREQTTAILKRIDDLGGPNAYGHYAAGWAVAL